MNAYNDTQDRIAAERIRIWRANWHPKPSPATVAIWTLFVLLVISLVWTLRGAIL